MFPIRKPKRITSLDSRIFANLIKAQRPLPVKQVAQRVGVTWPTANQHIQKLAKLNVLKVDKTIRKNRVNVDPNFLFKLKRNKSISNELKDWLYE